MWYRIVVIADRRTDFDPRYALRQQGDGPFVTDGHAAVPRLFDTIWDAVCWGRDHDANYIELAQPWPTNVAPITDDARRRYVW
jgi:hypothetical protein